MDEKHKEAQKAMDRVIKEVGLNCSCMLEFPHWHWISMDSAYNDRLVMCNYVVAEVIIAIDFIIGLLWPSRMARQVYNIDTS